MKITILAVGSRGDVQPCVALAQKLQKMDYQVTLATGVNFKDFVTERGIHFVPLRADFHTLFASASGKAFATGNTIGIMTAIRRMLRPMLEDAWHATHNSDAIIYNQSVAGGYDIAEKLKIPCFMVTSVGPIVAPNSEFPHPNFANYRLGKKFNRLSYLIVHLLFGPHHLVLNKWRKEILNLPPRSFFSPLLGFDSEPIPILYAYSPSVVPRPAAWDSSIAVTGFWFLERPKNWSPPTALVNFLEAGPPPVYIGFGSMIGTDPGRVTKIVLSALAKSGQRGVISCGWGGITGTALPDTVFNLPDVPFDWLFPYVSVVVHHGGAGTVAAGLRAGVPTIVCPYAVDQPFWGKVIYELGVGPKPIPQRKLTVDKLTYAIELALLNPEMRHKASVLGDKIRNEDGVEQATAIIHKKLSTMTSLL